MASRKQKTRGGTAAPARDSRGGGGHRTSPGASGKVSARGEAPGARVRVPLKGWGISLLLPLATVALLSLAFPPLRWAPAAHVALVPLLLLIARAPDRRTLLASTALAGVVLYAAQVHWLTMVTWSAYVGVVLYCLIFWVLFAVLVRWTLRRTRLPLALLAPVLWVALEWARSWVLTGFPWLFLGHPQATSPVLLQVADLTGAYGLSALSAATAGFITDLLTRPFFLRYGARIRTALSLRVSVALVLGAWVFVIGYGLWRLRPVEMADGPVVVTIQSSIPQELRWFLPETAGKAGDGQTGRAPDNPGGDEQPAGQGGNEEQEQKPDPGMVQVRRLTAEALADTPEPDLVVWPETTVPGYLNAWFLDAEIRDPAGAARDPEFARALKADPAYGPWLESMRRSQGRSRGYWQEIHRMLAGRDAAMLVGGVSMVSDATEPGGTAVCNSAFLFTRGDAVHAATERYDKVHLVPFGEYVPFRDSAPWLYRLLMKFTPYAEEYNLTPGKEYALLEVAGVAFGVPICFEDAFPGVCRRMAYRHGRKRADFLVNISNDGWFHGTVEQEQHWDLSVFRAVENRVPVVRSVNTGISGFIDSSGRAVSRVADEAGRVRSVIGREARRVQLDPRESVYGRYGDVFAVTLSIVALCLIIVAVFHPRSVAAEGGRATRANREGRR